ncbi:MAG: hypothetical protein KC646_16300 [Candidatus Cloacimonetes bacterium]|nr:hypothetical protein [Candidatus Cloacimonadota bacterium]
MDLVIDTVSQGLRLTLIDHGYDFNYLSLDKSCAHSLLKILEDELVKGSKSCDDIKRVFFNRGPGSFTGIKMGYVTAMTFALDPEVEVYSFTSFDVMHTQVNATSQDHFLLNAFQGDYFLANRSELAWDYQVVSSKELPNMQQAYYMGVQKYCREEFTSLNDFDEDILKKLVQKNYYSKETSPLYLKKSTAEIARDKKMGLI